MLYIALGYALTLAASEMPKMLSDTPVDSAQVEMLVEDPAVAPAVGQIAVSDPYAEPAVDHELERAARDFRIETYQTHRLDRATYDRHIASGQQLLSHWHQNPGDETQRAMLLAWFNQAETHARLAQPLPSLPTFLDSRQEMLAEDTTSLPQVVVQFPAAGEQSLLNTPQLETPLPPPTAAATPLPSTEMRQLEETYRNNPAEQATTTADPLDELDSLDWGASNESFDLEFNNDLEPEVNEYNRDVLGLLTYLGGDEPWTVANLEPIAMQLSDLAAQRQILSLRAQMQNADIPQLLTLEPAVAQFAERVQEARGHAERVDGSYPQADVLNRVEALEAVHARLTTDN